MQTLRQYRPWSADKTKRCNIGERTAWCGASHVGSFPVAGGSISKAKMLSGAGTVIENSAICRVIRGETSLVNHCRCSSQITIAVRVSGDGAIWNRW